MKNQKGFTLIELMIVVAIIGILASIALPAYQTYTKKAKFSEVVLAATPYKSAFEVAAQTGRISQLSEADAGSNGMPAAAGATGYVTSATIANGIVTATATTELDSLTYILTPNGITAPIQWSDDDSANVSSCIAEGIC